MGLRLNQSQFVVDISHQVKSPFREIFVSYRDKCGLGNLQVVVHNKGHGQNINIINSLGTVKIKRALSPPSPPPPPSPPIWGFTLTGALRYDKCCLPIKILMCYIYWHENNFADLISTAKWMPRMFTMFMLTNGYIWHFNHYFSMPIKVGIKS